MRGSEKSTATPLFINDAVIGDEISSDRNESGEELRIRTGEGHPEAFYTSRGTLVPARGSMRRLPDSRALEYSRQLEYGRTPSAII